MPIDAQVSIHGITDIGEWTAVSATEGGANTIHFNDDNVYTETSWGLTSEEGGRITPSVTTVTQRSGQSAAVIDSFISEANAQLQMRLIDGQLQTLRRLMGLPDSALTGDLGAATPTDEVLLVKGSQLGTEEKSIYLKTMGPLGPRTYYLPRCKLASFPELSHTRTDYFEPNATFDLYENDQGDMFWVIDAAV